MIDGNIAKDIYEAKNRDIQLRRQEIESRLKQMEEPADKDSQDSLGNIITTLSNSAEMFASSKTEQKRQMLGFVFSNLSLEGSSLRYSLRKPFELLQQVPRNPEWRAGQDESAKWELSLPIRSTPLKSSIKLPKEPTP